MENWLESKAENDFTVISSRIRLARNLNSIPFPNRLDEEQGKDLVKKVEDAFYISPDIEDTYKTIYLWQNEHSKNNTYLEKHLISPQLINNSKQAAFILNRNETISVMINEEDHLRVQSITGGFNLEEALEQANKIDDLLEERLEYAFDEKLGYLTACPTNLGTALRASVMLHLPALTANKEIVELLNALTQVGMTIRGLYGEGSNGDGNIYQISNQITLGLREEEILRNLTGVVNQIVDREKLARERIFNKNKYLVEDKVYRSVGVLKSAVILSSKEALSLLSNVRLGIELGIINDIDNGILNKLLVEIQPSTLQSIFNGKLSEKERDLNRAKLIKERLENLKL